MSETLPGRRLSLRSVGKPPLRAFGRKLVPKGQEAGLTGIFPYNLINLLEVFIEAAIFGGFEKGHGGNQRTCQLGGFVLAKGQVAFCLHRLPGG